MKCDKCKRGEYYFEGCSVVECPKRKTLTASYQEIMTPGMENTGAYFKVVTTKHDEEEFDDSLIANPYPELWDEGCH